MEETSGNASQHRYRLTVIQSRRCRRNPRKSPSCFDENPPYLYRIVPALGRILYSICYNDIGLFPEYFSGFGGPRVEIEIVIAPAPHETCPRSRSEDSGRSALSSLREMCR